MDFIPHTQREIEEMLRVVGVGSVEELFDHIPAEYLRRGKLVLGPPLGEREVVSRMRALAESNATAVSYACFLGAGAYNHFVPAVVNHILLRGEFLTSYTPYQPELSQGTLQSQFEYQTMVSRLLGLEVANASMYEGATALAEACVLARRHTRRTRIVVSRTVHPQYRAVLRTYFGKDAVRECPYSPETGQTDVEKLRSLLDPTVAAVVLQSPSYFGVVENLSPAVEVARESGALMVATFTEPLAFGLVAPPGDAGADVAAGEGQSLGLPLGFGGPYVGLFAARRRFLKAMPGRIVGLTKDRYGKECYVLVLSAREQHIKRGRAGSNICTNEGLCATAVAIYLSLLGKEGFRKLALTNHLRAVSFLRRLTALKGIRVAFDSPIFNEFVVRLPVSPNRVRDALLGERILAGHPLGVDYPELSDCLLVAVTECLSDADFDKYLCALERLLSNP